MKIIQLLNHLNIGDAIGGDVLAIDDALRGAGYETRIMALSIHERLRDRAVPAELSGMEEEDILLFHKANGDPFTGVLSSLPCYRVLIYHNMTPASFFWAYDPVMAWNQVQGGRQLRRVLRSADEAWGDSSFNCGEIIRCGYPREKTSVLPILLDLKKREAKTEGRTRILFLGRIAPNKKQEDLIKAFRCYLAYDPGAQLVLIGSWDGFEKYYAKLKGFAADLGLTEDQVLFTGRVTEAEKERWLSRGSLFLCMSEHEGFCIPVLEAMAWDLPVLAYRCCAVPETVGENGLLFDVKDFEKVAGMMNRVMKDRKFRESVLEKQRENLKRYDRRETEKKLLEKIGGIRGGKG